jgi:hypothetical protein
MRHPNSRSERRHNREVARNRRRAFMKTWYGYRDKSEDITKNRMWFHAGKQCVGHGNRCSCHVEKINDRRARRVALKTATDFSPFRGLKLAA